MKYDPLKPPLLASDDEISSLVWTARHTRCGPHGSNPYADILDLLVAHLAAADPDEAYSTAEDLASAATEMRNQAAEEFRWEA